MTINRAALAGTMALAVTLDATETLDGLAIPKLLAIVRDVVEVPPLKVAREVKVVVLLNAAPLVRVSVPAATKALPTLRLLTMETPPLSTSIRTTLFVARIMGALIPVVRRRKAAVLKARKSARLETATGIAPPMVFPAQPVPNISNCILPPSALVIIPRRAPVALEGFWI